MFIAQSGAQDTWTRVPWHAVQQWSLHWGGPIVFCALGVWAIGSALARRRRYCAVTELTDRDLAAVHAALQAAERRTVGEIVPVVFERSDAHPAARWRAALVTLFAGSALLAAWLPWHTPEWLMGCQLALAAVGVLVTTWLPHCRRWFVAEARATELAEEQAFQEFFRLRLHETAARTGVLLFVSLFERRVIVLGDTGIDAKVDASAWAGARDAVLAGIARGSLRDGLIAGIDALGDVLARHFPYVAGDRNEVPDRVIVQRE